MLKSLGFLFALGVIGAIGCSSDDPPLCGVVGNEPRTPVPPLLNPQNLQCVQFDNSCGACDCLEPGFDEGDREPTPTWGSCASPCRSLSESTCLAAIECRAAYDRDCFDGATCTAEQQFLGCFPIDQTGPLSGPCDGLDAQSCSGHPECLALHELVCTDGACTYEFVECRLEELCYAEAQCDQLPPTCADDEIPGVTNGCYSGNCILLDACEHRPCADTNNC